MMIASTAKPPPPMASQWYNSRLVQSIPNMVVSLHQEGVTNIWIGHRVTEAAATYKKISMVDLPEATCYSDAIAQLSPHVEETHSCGASLPGPSCCWRRCRWHEPEKPSRRQAKTSRWTATCPPTIPRTR